MCRGQPQQCGVTVRAALPVARPVQAAFAPLKALSARCTDAARPTIASRCGACIRAARTILREEPLIGVGWRDRVAGQHALRINRGQHMNSVPSTFVAVYPEYASSIRRHEGRGGGGTGAWETEGLGERSRSARASCCSALISEIRQAATPRRPASYRIGGWHRAIATDFGGACDAQRLVATP